MSLRNPMEPYEDPHTGETLYRSRPKTGPLYVVVGSENPVKIAAVQHVLDTCPLLGYRGTESREIKVTGYPAKSGVSEQPKTLDETVMGAMGRAQDIFANADHTIGHFDFTLGIESGITRVRSSGKLFDFCACALFAPSGIRSPLRFAPDFSLGLSSWWEVPEDLDVELDAHPEIDLDEAFFRRGYTTEKKVGHHEGAIGVLSRGWINRQAYTEQAVQMALVAFLRTPAGEALFEGS